MTTVTTRERHVKITAELRKLSMFLHFGMLAQCAATGLVGASQNSRPCSGPAVIDASCYGVLACIVSFISLFSVCVCKFVCVFI